MLGSILLSLALTMAAMSSLAYARAIRLRDTTSYRIGRFGFHGAVISFMFACAVLMYLILTHQYQYAYIYEHSSNTLSTPLLFASFYAGQQGSFMLWTLLTGMIGVFVLGYAQRVRYEAETMAVFMLVMTCLLVILVIKSPFESIWSAYADTTPAIPANFIPENGKGLNPQLENLWITIHPPILFTGFASMTVPFVFAIAGLIRRDYQRWVAIALPWALFASMVLGFGIMLGGWWAYGTLGWGGFWAWDPVENSSLVPWLACVALVHTLLVQRRTGGVPDRVTGELRIGGLVRTNFFLAILAYGMVLYSTFLTRSGVLGETSVHSFVTAGTFYLFFLASMNVVFFVGPLALLFARRKDLNLKMPTIRFLSRENALNMSAIVLMISVLVVVLGTSWPLIAPWFGLRKGAIGADVYNPIHIVIGSAIVLLNGLSMRLKWKITSPRDFWRQTAIAGGIAAVGTVGIVLLDVTDPPYLLLGFGAIMALVINVQTGFRVLRGNPGFIGSYVSHIGVSLLMLGIIFATRYSVTQHVRLVQNRPVEMFGYKLTYQGPEQIERDKPDRSKYVHHILMEKDGTKYEVQPITFLSDYNQRQGWFLEPGILYTATKDIYLSPKAIDQEGGDPYASMHKGERAKIKFDSSISVHFQRFDMSRAATERLQGAVMEVTTRDSTYALTALRTLDGKSQPVAVPGTDVTITFESLNADKDNLANSEAVLVFRSPTHPPPPSFPVVTLDVSIKPFISLVWGGVMVMVGGFFFSILRRRKELRLFVPDMVPLPRRNPPLGAGEAAPGEAK